MKVQQFSLRGRKLNTKTRRSLMFSRPAPLCPPVFFVSVQFPSGSANKHLVKSQSHIDMAPPADPGNLVFTTLMTGNGRSHASPSSLRHTRGVHCFWPEVSRVVPDVTREPSPSPASVFISLGTRGDPDRPGLQPGEGLQCSLAERLPASVCRDVLSGDGVVTVGRAAARAGQ